MTANWRTHYHPDGTDFCDDEDGVDGSPLLGVGNPDGASFAEGINFGCCTGIRDHAFDCPAYLAETSDPWFDQ